MESAECPSIELACVPSAIPSPGRAQHFVLARELLINEAAERVELPDGYAFRFAAEKLIELVRFIDNERKCCPFMTFDLKLGPEGGPLWLRMTGPLGAREVLQAALSLQDPWVPHMSVEAGSPSSLATAACGCATPANNHGRKVKLASVGAVLASLGICAACCLLPAILIGLGVTGSVVGALDSLAPYKWIFIVITAGLLGYGFYAIYWKPRKTCAAGAACETCGSGRSVRIALWLGTGLALGGIAYGTLEPWLTHR